MSSALRVALSIAAIRAASSAPLDSSIACVSVALSEALARPSRKSARSGS